MPSRLRLASRGAMPSQLPSGAPLGVAGLILVPILSWNFPSCRCLPVPSLLRWSPLRVRGRASGTLRGRRPLGWRGRPRSAAAGRAQARLLFERPAPAVSPGGVDFFLYTHTPTPVGNPSVEKSFASQTWSGAQSILAAAKAGSVQQVGL